MTEAEEFEALEQRLQMQQAQERQSNCQHRWEQSFFGQKHWAPGTYQYTCTRCGKMTMTRLETT